MKILILVGLLLLSPTLYSQSFKLKSIKKIDSLHLDIKHGDMVTNNNHIIYFDYSNFRFVIYNIKNKQSTYITIERGKGENELVMPVMYDSIDEYIYAIDPSIGKIFRVNLLTDEKNEYATDKHYDGITIDKTNKRILVYSTIGDNYFTTDLNFSENKTIYSSFPNDFIEERKHNFFATNGLFFFDQNIILIDSYHFPIVYTINENELSIYKYKRFEIPPINVKNGFASPEIQDFQTLTATYFNNSIISIKSSLKWKNDFNSSTLIIKGIATNGYQAYFLPFKAKLLTSSKNQLFIIDEKNILYEILIENI